MDKNCGKLLYEYSDARHALDMSKHERRRFIKSFTAICLLICVLLLTAWCVVNFVLDLQLYDDSSSVIKYYVILFIILGVVILITVLSVFGLWGIFMRKVSKSYRPHKIESRQNMEELQSEFHTVDKNKSRENALMIFDDRIVIKRNGEESVIDKNELTACSIMLIFMGLMFLFLFEEGVTKSPVTISSLLRHPTVYGLICLFFVSVGVSFIPNSIKSLIEYIKYR